VTQEATAGTLVAPTVVAAVGGTVTHEAATGTVSEAWAPPVTLPPPPNQNALYDPAPEVGEVTVV
jgi:hypothetical protein